jgi:uncharacterized glyoxalase superfamily protein PhnB
MPAVTPHLVCEGAANAIEFYKKAFGAEEAYRIGMPDGSVAHADIVIGNSHVMLGEAPQDGETKGTSASTFLYVDDVDAWFRKAIKSGAKEVQPVADMFWGDRYGRLVDPFGQEWQIATHKEDVSDEEMKRRMAALGR